MGKLENNLDYLRAAEEIPQDWLKAGCWVQRIGRVSKLGSHKAAHTVRDSHFQAAFPRSHRSPDTHPHSHPWWTGWSEYLAGGIWKKEIEKIKKDFFLQDAYLYLFILPLTDMSVHRRDLIIAYELTGFKPTWKWSAALKIYKASFFMHFFSHHHIQTATLLFILKRKFVKLKKLLCRERNMICFCNH